MSLRVLWSAWSNDPFTETIERQLARAIAEAGGTLLRITEGRRPDETPIPTIDLQDACLVDARPQAASVPPPGFDRIVTETHEFERIEGLASTREEVDARLRRCAEHAELILDRFRPRVVMVWNGLLSQRAVVALDACSRNTPVYYCERGMLPGSWYADPVGINAAGSLVCEPLAPGLRETLDSPLAPQQRQAVLEALAAASRAGASAWGQPAPRGPDAWRESLGIPENVKILFFPLQVGADTNMTRFSPHFADSVAALEAVAEALAGRDDWFLLVKPHPRGNYPAGRVEQIAARVRGAVADVNMHDALALASLVVTINSNAGAEAVWAGKPVLQLGRGILSDKSIVADYAPDRPMLEQIRQAVDIWSREPDRFDRGLRLYRYLREEFLLQADSIDDACRLVRRLAAAAGPVSDAPDDDPTPLVRRFTWRPAVDLFDRIGRRPAVRNAVLVGFGQNALRLLQAAPLHPVGRSLCWSAWDDDETSREHARKRGLPLTDPFSRTISEDTLLVVTPRDAHDLGRRLADRGYRAEAQWLHLFQPAGQPR